VRFEFSRLKFLQQLLLIFLFSCQEIVSMAFGLFVVLKLKREGIVAFWALWGFFERIKGGVFPQNETV